MIPVKCLILMFDPYWVVYPYLNDFLQSCYPYGVIRCKTMW